MSQNQALTDLTRNDALIGDIPTEAILMVDDNQDSLQAASDVLTDDQRPNLGQLDVVMPGLSGVDVLRIICSRSDFKDIPVILITVPDDPLDVAHGLELGANDHLIKPINHDILAARVRVQHRLKQHLDQQQRNARHPADLNIALRFGQNYGRVCAGSKSRILGRES